MRFAISIVALAAAVFAAAQDPFYRRVGADGPPVLDGPSQCLAVSANGWALIRTLASNAVAPATYGGAMILRSPNGTLEPIVFPDEISLYLTAGIREDGEIVVFQSSFDILVYRRSTKTFQHYDSPTGSGPGGGIAVVGEKAIFAYDAGRSWSMDLTTGRRTWNPAPLYRELLPEQVLRVGVNGRWAVASADGGYSFIDLESGNVREWKFEDETGDYRFGIVEPSGTAVWAIAGRFTTARLVRHNFINGQTDTYPAPGLEQASLLDAAGRWVFFIDALRLVPQDTNVRNDVYAFDRTDGSYKLVSRKADGTASGDVGTFRADLAGKEVFYGPIPDLSDPLTGPYGNLYSGPVWQGSLEPVLQAEAPFAWRSLQQEALSPSGKVALLNRNNEVKLDDNGVVSTLAAENQFFTAVAVTDDAKVAIWTGPNNKLRIWRKGIGIKTIDATSAYPIHWDPKTRQVIYSGLYNAGKYQLSAYNPATDEVHNLAPLSAIVFDYDAAGGYAAHRLVDKVIVTDLSTWSTVTIPLESGTGHLGPRITGDGVYVSIATNRSSIGRFFRTRDGAFRRTTPYGLAMRNPEWLKEAVGDGFIYTATGARVAGTLLENLRTTGPVVGPPAIQDGFVFHPKARAKPEIGFFRTVPGPGGVADIFTGSLNQAGLENSPTRLRYRVDGGPWKFFDINRVYLRLTLPDGEHQIDGQAFDSLGREGDIVKNWVVTDSLPPVLEPPTARITPDGLMIRIVASGGSQAQLALYENDQALGYEPVITRSNGYEYLLKDPKPGTRYRFVFKITDGVGNESTAQGEIVTP
ncbi:hypothetical protein EON81_09615 [bacterium]|nr:MAG: hypothetical protein EON81_09615 [bacterium]